MNGHGNYQPVNVENIHKAEIVLLTNIQAQAFSEEVEILRSSTDQSVKIINNQLKQSSCLYCLDPYIGDDGLIHVGGDSLHKKLCKM